MQMLLVARSRRMCCSRVCSANRYAGLPEESTETPTRRPGSWRSSPDRTAMTPACGPPKPMGTPKRWAEPTTMSAPHSPGGVSRHRLSRSAATTRPAPSACTCSARADSAAGSRTSPVEVGTETRTPKQPSAGSPAVTSRTSRTIPSGVARVSRTASVCGCVSASTTKVIAPVRSTRCSRAIASAAAVGSSSMEALARGRPVRSATIVWKLSSASSRPWEISGW